MSVLLDMIGARRLPVIGMVQLGPLPGSARWTGGALKGLIDDAKAEAAALAEAGVDILMVQNLGDLPVATHVVPEQIAWTVRIADEVRRESGLAVGLNLLENDAGAMMCVASAAGLDFIRVKIFVGVMVTPFGLETAAAHDALKSRHALRAEDVAIFADVHDRTGVALGQPDLEEDIGHALKLGGADGLVLTGRNHEQSLDFIRTAKAIAPSAPVLIGGGASADNVAEILELADGAIVSSSLKPSGSAFGRIDPERARRFMDAVETARRRAKPN